MSEHPQGEPHSPPDDSTDSDDSTSADADDDSKGITAKEIAAYRRRVAQSYTAALEALDEATGISTASGLYQAKGWPGDERVTVELELYPAEIFVALDYLQLLAQDQPAEKAVPLLRLVDRLMIEAPEGVNCRTVDRRLAEANADDGEDAGADRGDDEGPDPAPIGPDGTGPAADVDVDGEADE
jgi:hypothetical protein